MKNVFALSVAIFLALIGIANAATLTANPLTIAGLTGGTLASASTGDKVSNDGNTFLMFYNTATSAPTLTLTVQNATVNTAGYNPLTIANPTVVLSSSGTFGGVTIVGPFGTSEFNDTSGYLNYTLSSSTGVNVSVVKVPRQN